MSCRGCKLCDGLVAGGSDESDQEQFVAPASQRGVHADECLIAEARELLQWLACGERLPLSGRATYLYADSGRYWYGVQPSVARSRAAVPNATSASCVTRSAERSCAACSAQTGQRSEFRGVHPPRTSAEIPGEAQVRLVLLGPEHAHLNRSISSATLTKAREILKWRGNAPRDYPNMVAFLAADERRLDELERGVAEYLAWASVRDEAGADCLNLDPNQARQAATKAGESDHTVDLRMGETYQWLLIPAQPDPTGTIEWDQVRDFGKIADEVITHLASQLGTSLEITVEISAANEDGFQDATVRTVSENSKTLKFSDFGFEER